jgi:hypothetical protein
MSDDTETKDLTPLTRLCATSIEELIGNMPVANAVLYNVNTRKQITHLKNLVSEKNSCLSSNKKFHVWRPYRSEYINVARLV